MKKIIFLISFAVISTLTNVKGQVPAHSPLDNNFENNLWGNRVTNYNITQTFYVNGTSGNDGNSGTLAQPFQTINAALSRRSAGTRIIIMPGTYRESLIFSAFSGTETQPLIIEAKDKGTVVISGSDVWTGWVQQPESDVYARAWFSTNFPVDHFDYPPGVDPNSLTTIHPLGLRREMLFIDHEQMEQVANKSDLKPKSFWIDLNAHMVYIKMASGQNPNSKLVEVPTRDRVLQTGLYYLPSFASYFVLNGLVFEHAVIDNELGGYHFEVEDCEFRNNGASGVQTMGSDIVFKRVRFINNGGNGAAIGPLFNDAVEHDALFEQCTFIGNKWRTAFYGNYWGDATSTFKILTYRNLIVRGCKLTNNWAGGIWFDNTVVNATIEDCYIADNTVNVPNIYYEISGGDYLLKNNLIANGGYGISLSNSAYATIKGNIFYNNIRSIGSNWDPAYIRNDGGEGAADHKTIQPGIFNNILVAKDASQRLIDMPNFEQLYSGNDKIIANYNTFFAPTKNVFNNGLNALVDLPGWQGRIYGDMQSRFEDPNFIDPSKGNYNVKTGSSLLSDPSWGFVTATQLGNTVVLSANRSDVVIRYTLDGTLPIKSSPIYSLPLNGVSLNTVLARAYSSNSNIEIFSPVSGIGEMTTNNVVKEMIIPSRIEAEDYSAYYDSDNQNVLGQYRNDGVDIESTSDIGGGYDVGYIATNEWLQYAISVPFTYNYNIKLRVSGFGGKASIKLDGQEVIPPTDIPSTGAWQTWADVNLGNIIIPEGKHTLQIFMNSSQFNLNYMQVAYSRGPDFTGQQLITAKHSSMAMSTDGSTNVFQHTYTGDDYQKWTLTQVQDGVYEIKNIKQDFVLDISGAKTDNQTNVDVYNDLNQPNQRFGLLDAGNGYYYVIAIQSAKNVEVFGATMGENDNISIYQPLGTDNQKWKISSVLLATQSSVNYGGTPSLAIDGNISGDFQNSSVTHTLVESNPWWTLDSHVSQPISQLKLYNRTDCCSDRLHDFYVFVSDSPFASTDPTVTVNTPGVWSYYYPGIAGSNVLLDVNRSGRYVRVQIPGSNEVLSLAEVVFTSGETPTVRNYSGKWDFTSSPEGWALTNALSGSIATNVYDLTITASDPYLHSPNQLNLDASTHNYVTVRLKNQTSDTQAELYWITNANTNYEDVNKHLIFTIKPNDNAYTDYSIDLGSNPNWTGIIKQIRIDPSRNANTGEIDVDYIGLDQAPQCSASITVGGSTTFCQGSNVVLTSSSGASYKWMNGTTQVGTAQTYTATSSGSYTVEVTNAAGCKATSTATVITVNALPTATINSLANSFCAGSSIVLIASTGASYKWFSGTTQVGTDATYTATAAGSYTVEVTNVAGCSVTSAETLISLIASSATITSSTTSLCQGESVVLNANSGASYKWMNGTTQVGTAQTYTATSSGSYTVEVTNAAGCKATSAAKLITVNALPTATITSPGTSFCQGTNVVLTSSSGASYKWMNGTTQVGTAATYTATASGSYTVEVTNAAGCKATSTATVLTASVPTIWYADTDNDGKGDANTTQTSCTQPSGYVSTAGDACPTDANKLASGNCGCGNTEQSCLDCAGIPNGTAVLDVCMICSGGTTGRVAVIDIDLCKVTTGNVSISKIEEIKVLPNPFSDKIDLIVPLEAVVQLFDASGKLVYEGSNIYFIETSHLSNGLYLLRISTSTGVSVMKMEKQ